MWNCTIHFSSELAKLLSQPVCIILYHGTRTLQIQWEPVHLFQIPRYLLKVYWLQWGSTLSLIMLVVYFLYIFSSVENHAFTGPWKLRVTYIPKGIPHWKDTANIDWLPCLCGACQSSGTVPPQCYWDLASIVLGSGLCVWTKRIWVFKWCHLWLMFSHIWHQVSKQHHGALLVFCYSSSLFWETLWYQNGCAEQCNLTWHLWPWPEVTF